MFLVRDIMYCRPGKVRPMVEKFLALKKLLEDAGEGTMRVSTDISAERYWTVVAEMEVPDLDAYFEMTQNTSGSEEMDEIMAGYHDLIEHGRREIYTIEG